MTLKDPDQTPKDDPQADQTVIAVSADTMGRDDEVLGQVLLRSHLHTLTELETKPHALIFFNTGVRLAVEGSQVLEDLSALADQGVQILLCGTCLKHFGLSDKVAVGEVSNMYAISETMLGATRLVNL